MLTCERVRSASGDISHHGWLGTVRRTTVHREKMEGWGGEVMPTPFRWRAIYCAEGS